MLRESAAMPAATKRAALAALLAATSAHPQEGHSHAPQLFLGTPLAGDGPEQQWLALGPTPDAMALSWVTSVNASSECQYGPTPAMALTATGAAGARYSTLGYTSGFIHVVRLANLALGTVYYYRCGDPARGAWTTPSTFTSSPGVGPTIPYTFGVIGDLGQTNYSNATMQHILAAQHIDSVFITGDISYADSEQPRWDSFQRLAQPLASSKGFMTSSGNHELEVSLYTAFQARFATMPSGGRADGALYFSYEVGPAHVLVVASFWLYEVGSDQYKFIVADLAAFDRARTPWLIVVLHAPWYNSNSQHTNDGQLMVRRGAAPAHAALPRTHSNSTPSHAALHSRRPRQPPARDA